MRALPQTFARRPDPFKAGRAACISLLLATLAVAQGEIRHTFTGANVGDEYGSVISTVGDLNLDGYPDVIVGAPFDLPALGNRGSATVYSGLNGSVLYALQGSAPNQLFGLGAAGAGDVNHDGIPDFIVGLSANGSTGLGPGGGARVFSGANGTILRTFAGTIANDAFGQTVAGLGDLNGDGFDEVIVGTSFSPGAAQPGYAKVFSGATGLALYTKTGTFNGQRFGQVYPAGDVDNDGINDFIVSAIGNNVHGTNSGSVFVYSGASGALIYTAHGAAQQNLFGYSAQGVGDVNGDGFGEIIVGTYYPAGMGYANVYSGADGSILHHLTNGITGDAFGHSVAGVGDVNGDGTKDMVVAAPNSPIGGTNSGRITVYSGVDGSVLRDFIGATPLIHFGYSVNPAGDVNGDGFKDLCVGFLVPSSTGLPGRAQVLSLCAAQPYGAGLLPTQTLSLTWVPGATQVADGHLHLAGSGPSSAGIIAASFAPANFTLLDVPILIDPSPGFLQMFDIVYDESGLVDISLNLRNPFISGVTFYAECFETNVNASSGWYASNGLMLLFGL